MLSKNIFKRKFLWNKLSNHFKEAKSLIYFKNQIQERTGTSCTCCILYIYIYLAININIIICFFYILNLFIQACNHCFYMLVSCVYVPYVWYYICTIQLSIKITTTTTTTTTLKMSRGHYLRYFILKNNQSFLFFNR